MSYSHRVKTPLLLLAAASLLPVHALAARVQDPQQVMGLDLAACPRPAYPAAALAQRAGGITTVEVQIGAQGVVTEGRVAKSSGRTDLDEAALAGIRRCVFHAVLAIGQAPTGWLKTQYVWVPGEAQRTAAQNQALYDSTVARADAGDAVAQNQIGVWHEHGTYGKTDPAQAAAWYLRAAQGGNAVAQNNLGVLYSRGAGVPRDHKQAVYWYAKAAEQGHGWAQANLGVAYQYDIAGETDIDKARYWLTKSANGGLAAAQVALGVLEMQAGASDEDRVTARAWFERAAARKEPAGQYFLGRSFELGLGTARDDAQAAARYREVLERSGGRAEVALGRLLDAGRASDADPDKAAKLYQRAMQWRYPPAYYHYGRLLEQRGDTDLAAAVYRQGAELGSCDAVLRYVALHQVAGTTPAAGTSDADWRQRAAGCAARPAQPPLLQ